MKKLSFLFMLLLFTGAANITKAQIRFKPGYFIDNEGVKKQCLIKDVDWTITPDDFSYKTSENQEVMTGKINEVQEFGVDSVVKFKRFNVKIDRSPDIINLISKKPKPIYESALIFLKELVSGETNLYSYRNGEITRYFFNNTDLSITQLVYKKYSKKGYMATNEQYKSQLFGYVNCVKNSVSKINQVKYFQKDLIKYFIEHNKCSTGEYFSFYDPANKKKKENSIHLNLRAGSTIASFFVENRSSRRFDGDFGTKVIPRIGLELEIDIPNSNKKWSFILEPYYTSFKKDIILQNAIQTLIDEGSINFSTLEISTGIRYYMFLSDNSKLYINGGISIGMTGDSFLSIERVRDFDLISGQRFNAAIGYSFKNKFFLEYRQNTSHSIIEASLGWNSQYKSRSVTLGYRIF